jgi:Rrf2 family protein
MSLKKCKYLAFLRDMQIFFHFFKKYVDRMCIITYHIIPIDLVIYSNGNEMKLSKKCQYSLKAVFELAWQEKVEPIRASEIAKAQHVSLRFMEIILNELKHGGFVASRRGNEGGYLLAKDAGDITVKEIIEHIEGPILLVQSSDNTNAIGDEAFRELWQQVNTVIGEVCAKTTFADLVGFERAKRNKCVLDYSI